MKTIIILVLLLLGYIVIKLLTFTKCKTKIENWPGTNLLKEKTQICYNRDTKIWVNNGDSIHFNINGTKSKELKYNNGYLDGVQNIYDNDGNLNEIIIYEFGNLITKIKQ